MKHCPCIEWERGSYQIYGAQGLAYMHGMLYDGGEFSYCPWCGTELEDV